MERKLNHDDFDQFLKDNADDLRMKPSGAVWEQISKELNRKKRRVAGLFLAGLTFFFGGMFTWYTVQMASTPDPLANIVTVQNSTAKANNTPSSTDQSFFPAQPKAAYTIQQKSFVSKNQLAQKGVSASAASERKISIAQAASVNIFGPQETAMPGADANQLENTPNLSEAANRPIPSVIGLLPSGKSQSAPQLYAQQQSLNLKPEATAIQTEAEVAIAAPAKKKRLLSWSIFATPTVSYRKLSENKTFDRPFLTPGTPPMVSALYNINNAVIHKPDLGLELGIAAKYDLTKKLKLRSGFQFNMSRYDIKAFSYVPEVATIALSSGFGIDSVRAVSSYRNFANGSRFNWLQNMYFQASLPVGLEYEIASNKNVKWSVASSIQPTYVIGNRSYMITADYKNYARVPWLTRRWNMNTNVETFVTIQSGKTEWHIGPQMRYQALSSFVKKYPVKENLFDFGMKVGITIK